MTDTSSSIAMRPPRIGEGYSLPTPPERERFFGTARSMAAPALEAARENLEASRGGVGDYFLNMPLAALNLADAAVRGGVGAFADLIPGLTPAAERDLAREILAMGEAAAGSAARVPSALDEGLGGLSEVARRMYQEGPVPDRLMAGIDPEEFLRLMRGRRDAAELQRRREDMIAGGIPEAEVDRRLGIVPRTADPDVALSDFAQARERMMGASNDLSFGELQGLIDAQAAARRGVVEALSGSPSVRLFDRNDRAVVVGPGMGPGEEGRFRVTYFDADRQPSNHTVYETKEEALNAALREGFVSRTAAPSPEDFGFYQDNPALKRSSGVEWLENKQRIADETYAERRGITGSTTATLGQREDMFLPTDFLRRIPGLNDENRRPGDPRYDELLRDVQRRGFLPDQDRNKVVLGINHRGEPFLVEGNTRVAVASDVGVPNVRVEVIYKNGGEMVDGPFSPENVARIAARGPAATARGVSVEDAGQGLFRVSVAGQPAGSLQLSPSGNYMSSAFLNPEFTGRRYGMDAYDLVERQIGRRLVPSPLGLSANAVPFWQRRLGQMSQEERVDVLQRAYESGIAAGAPERDILIRLSSLLPRGDDLFAAVERSKSAARGPSGSEPENFAQGGAVMMRSDMPEQIHQGVGSLSEVARRMFQGGEVFSSMGNPLAPYEQYLTQTYAAPIQQSAQQAVGQFVNSVRQKEQAYFGGGGMGGGMSSPMPPGGMQMAQHSALQASMPAPDQSGVARDTISGGLGFLGLPPAGAMTASPFGNSLNQQQMMGQRRLDAMQPSNVAANQANLANAQFTAPSSAPGATLSDAFASRFGDNWADQFSLTTPNNRARLGIV